MFITILHRFSQYDCKSSFRLHNQILCFISFLAEGHKFVSCLSSVYFGVCLLYIFWHYFGYEIVIGYNMLRKMPHTWHEWIFRIANIKEIRMFCAHTLLLLYIYQKCWKLSEYLSDLYLVNQVLCVVLNFIYCTLKAYILSLLLLA